MQIFQTRLRHVFDAWAIDFDATTPLPPVWAIVASGAGLGLVWGIAARLWMRLISARPEFSIAGTAAILTIATIFGVCTGLAFAARRRGWRSWRHYVPRGLAVAFFLPFGIAGGTPLMLTVLLATLALTQPAIVGLWVVAALAVLLAVATDIDIPRVVVLGAPAVAGALTIWKWFAHNGASRPWVSRMDGWTERAGQLLLLFMATAGLVVVAREIASAKPPILAAIAMILYIALLYPLALALRVGLAPRTSAGGSD